MYNVKLTHVRVTIMAVEKMCVCDLRYTARKAQTP